MTPEMIDRLVRQRERIDTQVTELTATRDRLDELIAATRAPAAASVVPLP